VLRSRGAAPDHANRSDLQQQSHCGAIPYVRPGCSAYSSNCHRAGRHVEHHSAMGLVLRSDQHRGREGPHGSVMPHAPPGSGSVNE